MSVLILLHFKPNNSESLVKTKKDPSISQNKSPYVNVPECRDPIRSRGRLEPDSRLGRSRNSVGRRSGTRFGPSPKKLEVFNIIILLIFIMGNDHEVEFHEIEIQLFQEVKFSIMRSKFLIMNILQKRSGDRIGPRGP